MLFKMTAPNDLAALLPILAFEEELAAGLKFGERESLSIRLALEEAITNVIEHAFEPGQEESFDVLFETDSSKLTITIREKGMPLEIRQAADPKATQGTRGLGLGLKLMNAAMDQIDFRNLGREGKELRLIKHLPRAAEPEGAGASVTPSPAGCVRAHVGPFKVRPFEPEDAAKVSRVAYKTYRYTYNDEFIYYPDQIVEMNRQGKIHSAIASNEAGEVVGHAAFKLAEPGAPVAEAGLLMVTPEYRHTRAVLRLAQFIMAKAEEMGMEGVYAQAVTSHTISQKATALFGFKDCAILLGAFYSDLTFYGIDAEAGQKESGVVTYRQFVPRATRNLYPPALHRDVVRTLYDSLGLPVNLPEAPTAAPVGPSALHCARNTTTNTVEIVVESYGATVVADIAGILRDLKLDRFDSACLRLDLEHPLTSSLAEEFERLGFFFAGVLPYGHSGKDCLILQYLNNLRIDYSKVRIHSERGQELLQYVEHAANGPLHETPSA